MAQPPIPPNNPVTIFAPPCAKHSLFEFPLVSVNSSIKLKHLSEDCKILLYKSSPKFHEVIVEAIDDPRYHLAENPEAFTKSLSEYKL
jgi:hypothetical protein